MVGNHQKLIIRTHNLLTHISFCLNQAQIPFHAAHIWSSRPKFYIQSLLSSFTGFGSCLTLHVGVVGSQDCGYRGIGESGHGQADGAQQYQDSGSFDCLRGNGWVYPHTYTKTGSGMVWMD